MHAAAVQVEQILAGQTTAFPLCLIAFVQDVSEHQLVVTWRRIHTKVTGKANQLSSIQAAHVTVGNTLDTLLEHLG